MATYIQYTPTTIIGRAMFNFDVYGRQNFKYSGVIGVSVSDSFTTSDQSSGQYSNFYSSLSNLAVGEIDWTTTQISNIRDILNIFSQFCNISFEWRGDIDSIGIESTPNPEDVGKAKLSDINIALINRSEGEFAGISGGSDDRLLNYAGAAGDIFMNVAAAKFNQDLSFGINSPIRQTLMHELGHSLGLSHPHSSFTNGIPTLTADFMATMYVGFEKLGFKMESPSDMYKEYFTIMSYDDQVSLLATSTTIWNAHTPMILDVIALQQAYGRGTGTSGLGSDTITAGTAGYRTYFDLGGNDTIDMKNYDEGCYLNMGVQIIGASHLVGVGMSLYDARTTVVNQGNPGHLRWFYGEYENASGSHLTDAIIGNSLPNSISGADGDDFLDGEEGNDTLNGGNGDDEMLGGFGDDYFDWDGTGRNGNDTMTGGPGNDVYCLSSAGDSVIEMPGEGIDTVFSGLNYSIVDTYIENLGTYLNFSSPLLFVGNSFGNRITTGGGRDTLFGNEGNDTLDGDSGADRLWGGIGNDTYYTDTQSDLVFENPSEGTDSVISTSSFYLYANVENLTLSGSAYFGVGNELDNTLIGNDAENLLIAGTGNDVLRGGAARDALFGEAGADLLHGDAGVDYIVAGTGNDTVYGGNDADEVYGQDGNDLIYGGNDFATDILVGGEGNDTLDGGPAWDQMYGGAGNDTFVVSQQVDWVFEQPGEGTDTVIADSPNGYYLYANVENLTLVGTTPFGVGNELANLLLGNAIGNTLLAGAGNDTLDGGAGLDILWGQDGGDTFRISKGTGTDIVADFQLGTDKLDVSAYGFTTLAQLKARMTQVGADIALNLDGGDQVILIGVSAAGFSAGDVVLNGGGG